MTLLTFVLKYISKWAKAKTHMAEIESRKMSKLHKKMNQINPNISGI